MTEQEPIRICFCTSELDFCDVLGRALGEGFEVKLDDGRNAAAASCQEASDCVLLDLRDLPTGAEPEVGLRRFEKFRRIDFAPPVVVMLGDDDATLRLRLVEAGAYDVLASPPDIVELRWVLRRAHRLRQVEMELRQLAPRKFRAPARQSHWLHRKHAGRFCHGSQGGALRCQRVDHGRNGHGQERAVPRPASTAAPAVPRRL